VDVWGLGGIINELGYKHYLLGRQEWHSTRMKVAYEGLTIVDRKKRWTLDKLKQSDWLQGVIIGTEAPEMRMKPAESSMANSEIQSCGALGEICRFNGRFRAIDARLPESFQGPKKLSEMSLSGIVWTVLLVQRRNNQFDSFPNFATELNGGDRVVFGVRDRGALAAETQLFLDLSRGDLGSANARWYMLDLDCFEFTKEVVGEEAVLGIEMHAAAVSKEHNRAIPALGFRGSYKLNLAGVAMPNEGGGLQVEWLPLPTFIVKPGYWGLVARVPTPPFGRSRRCPQFTEPRTAMPLTYPQALSLSS
jgi:hypothetical protein